MRSARGIASRICAALIGGVIVVGCAGPAPRPARVGYADLGPLLALHPRAAGAAMQSWAQAASRAAAEPCPQVAMPSSPSFAPLPLATLEAPPPEATLARVTGVTENELARAAADLEARAQERLARAARDAAREAEAALAQRRIEVSREVARQRRQVLLERREGLHRVGLQIANLERELKQENLTPAERAATEQRLQALRSQQEQELAEQSAHLDELEARLQAQLQAIEREAQNRVARQVADLAQGLAQARREQLQAQRARLAQPLAAAAQQLDMALQLPQPEPLRLSAGALPQQVRRAAQHLRRQTRASSRSWSRAASALTRERRRAMETIARDTRTTAQTLARSRNWCIIWDRQAHPDAPDITGRVAQWLRAYWEAQ